MATPPAPSIILLPLLLLLLLLLLRLEVTQMPNQQRELSQLRTADAFALSALRSVRPLLT
jgi:hypothetical protein